MSIVDAVVIKPGSQQALYGELGAFELTAIEPPLWGALLAGQLRSQGCSVMILDQEVEHWSAAETACRVAEIGPRLAVVVAAGTNPSASTMNMLGAGELCRGLRDHAPEVKICLTGLHPTALPERTLREEACDFVCVGEGLYSIPALAQALYAGKAQPRVAGVWSKDGEHLVRSNPPPLCEELNLVAMPAWDLLPMARYRAHNWHCFDDIKRRQPYGVIYTSLGCPYNCSFCCTNALFGKRGIRFRSPELVVEEIDFLVTQYGIRNIKIIDEMFVLKREHVLRFCDLLIDRAYDLNMWAYARVNTVDPQILQRMKRAGINWVAYGFESGSKRVLDGVAKGYRPEQITEVVRFTYDAGLHIAANFVFGLPEDDLASMEESFALAQEINAEWGNFYATMAYPGSKLYEQAVREGWPLPANWRGYSQYASDCTPLPTRHLSGEQVLEFRDNAFHRYYSDARYLAKMRQTFGDDTVEYVKKMSARRLVRKGARHERNAESVAVHG